MPVGSLNGKPVSTALANSPLIQVDANGVFQPQTSPLGKLILIQTQTASNSANISFNNLSAYNNFLLVCNGVQPVTNGSSLRMVVSQNNGSTYLNTSYFGGVNYGAYNTATLTNSNSTTDNPLSGPLGNTGEYVSNLFLSSLNLPTYMGVNGNGSWFDNSPAVNAGKIGCLMNQTGVNAFRLQMSSGNFNGNFSLYGISPT